MKRYVRCSTTSDNLISAEDVRDLLKLATREAPGRLIIKGDAVQYTSADDDYSAFATLGELANALNAANIDTDDLYEYPFDYLSDHFTEETYCRSHREVPKYRQEKAELREKYFGQSPNKKPTFVKQHKDIIYAIYEKATNGHIEKMPDYTYYSSDSVDKALDRCVKKKGNAVLFGGGPYSLGLAYVLSEAYDPHIDFRDGGWKNLSAEQKTHLMSRISMMLDYVASLGIEGATFDKRNNCIVVPLSNFE